MTPAEERSRPAIWGPVLIAAIFLAIIGGSAGWVIGTQRESAERELAERQAALEQQQLDQQAGGPQQSPDGGDPAVDPSVGPDQGGTRPTEPVSTDRCPTRTVQWAEGAGAYGKVSLLRYLRTNTSEVWICVDANDRLFYQGHRGAPGEAWIEGQNVLFLTDVVDKGEYYQATNTTGGKSTCYEVYRNELVIRNANGNVSREPALAPGS